MKKMLLSIVLAAMTLSANAADDQREYESLLSESKVWTMSYQGVVNPVLGRRHLQIGLPRMSIWGRMGERSIGILTGLRMWCWIWMCL